MLFQVQPSGVFNMVTPSPSSVRLVGRRYILQEMLGRGGMGAVYRATDRLTGQQVALKQVLTDESLLATAGTNASSLSIRVALAHEFQTLASVRHPHIIPVLDYGFDEEKQPYFTMSLLEKPQLFTHFGRSKSIQQKLQLLLEMLQALAYLHQRGIIHCDLKPENALVTPDDGVRVLDFGLATLQDQRRTNDQDILGGTLTYMAPEVMQGMSVSVAADLYAVGIMAYELFAGHYPFEYSNISQLIQHTLYTVPDVSKLDVDYEIAEVIRKLLAKEPAERYANAYEVIEALSKAAGQAIPTETTAIRESYLQTARFLGREAEMSQLRAALKTAIGGSGSAWLISGETGVGKSRVNEELRIQGLVQGAVVLRGQGVSGGGLPYQVWREPLRRLILISDLDDLDAGILKDIVPDIEQLLGRPIPGVVALEGTAYQQRLIGTIASLFQRQKTPILLLLEDLQWTGESLDILKVINNLVKDLPLMVVANYRHEERPQLAEELSDMRLIKLERLTRSDIEALTVSIMGDAGRLPAINNLLMKETGGNVFFLIEIVRVLAEEVGRLQDIGRMSIPHHVFAGGIQQAITRRLNRVPDDARSLLRIAAAAGRDLDLKLLQRIAGQDDLEDWLTICSNCAVLEVQDGQWHFPYDQLRQALLNDLPQPEQAKLYRQIAETIEAMYPDVPEQALVLVNYWRSAGDHTKELFYARRAGEYSLKISALSDAVLNFRRALELLPEINPQDEDDLRADLLIKLGESLKYTGDYNAAHEHLAEALELRRKNGDQPGIAQALLGLGDVVSFQGDLPGAVAFSQQALRVYQEQNVKRGVARATSQLGRILTQQGEYDEAIRYLEDSLAISRSLQDVEGIAITINNLGTVAFQRGDHASARRYFDETLTMSRTSGERRKVAVASMNLGSVAGMTQDFAGATRYFEEALRIGREIGERRIVAMSIDNLGYLASLQHDYAMAIRYLEESLELAREIGNRQGMATSLLNLGHVSKTMEQTDDAVKYYHQALALAREINAYPTILETLTGLAEVTPDLPQALNWLGLVLNHPALNDETRQMAEAAVAALRTRDELTKAIITEKVDQGKTLILELVITAILENVEVKS